MLMEVPLSYAQSNGYGYKWSNVGGMVNRGAEINLTGTVLQIKDFNWTMNANVSYNHNRITELYNGVTEYENANTNTKLVQGHPLGEFYINRYAGVNPALNPNLAMNMRPRKLIRASRSLLHVGLSALWV